MIKYWIRAAAVVAAMALSGALLAAVPASAQQMYEGKVVARSGLAVRHSPTTVSRKKGTLEKGQTIEIVCKVRGTNVDGNRRWYALPPTLNEWVSARYVENIGEAPRTCGSDERFVGRTTSKVNVRVAPHTGTRVVAVLARGAGVDIICKLPAQWVDGNNLWYYMTNGRWVSARYVDNVGEPPRWCN